MKLYRNKKEIADIWLKDGSHHSEEINADHLIQIEFDVLNPLDLTIDDYIVFNSSEYSIRYKEKIVKTETSLGYNYSITLYQEVYKLIDVPFFLFGKRERKKNFDTYTGTAMQVLNLVVKSMNAELGGGWSVGSCLDTAPKTYNMHDMQCSDVVNLLCSENTAEVWCENKAIHLGKREYSSGGLTLGQGDGNGFTELEISAVDDTPPFTVIYPYGGEQNLGSDYEADYLLLPDGKSELTKNVDKYGRRGKHVAFDHIFPKGEFHVSEKIDTFTLKASDINFNLTDCLLDDVEVIVTFQDGGLAGYDLAIVEGSWSNETKQFKLKLNEQENALKVPGDINFEVGDMFILTGLKMPQSDIANAELKLQDEAQKWLDEHCENRIQLRGKCDNILFKERGLQISCGQMVGIYSQKLNIDREIRVTAVKRYLENDDIQPYRYELTLSDFLQGNGFKQLVNDVKAIPNTILGQVKPVYEFTKRAYRDAKETQQHTFDVISNYFTGGIQPITVEMMHALIANPMLQFIFLESKDSVMEIDPGINWINDHNIMVVLEGAWLKHMTLGIDYMGGQPRNEEYRYWHMPEFESDALSPAVDNQVHYLYAKCSKTSETGEYILSTEKITMEKYDGYYHFLIGQLNSKYDQSRSFAFMYGFFEITPGQMTGRRWQSTDGYQFWDFVLKNFQIGDENSYLKYDHEKREMILRGSLIQDKAGDPVTIYKGDYQPNIYYSLGNEVMYNGIVYHYVGRESVKGVLPTNTTYWKLKVEGKDGQPGATGQPGQPGKDGTNGLDGKSVSLIASSQVFKTDKSGSTTPSSITLTCQTNIVNPSYQWYQQSPYDGTWSHLGGGYGMNTYTIAPTFYLLTLFPSVTLRCTINGDLSDQITISKLIDGSDAYSVILDNEAHTVACDASGTPLAGELAKALTQVVVYKGTTKLQPVSNYLTPTAGQFNCGIASEDGCSSFWYDQVSYQLGITSLYSNTAKVRFNINCEHKTNIFKEFTITKAKSGAAGNAGLPGPTMAFRGEYSPSEIYLGTPNHRNVVKFNSYYYYTTANAGSFSSISPVSTEKWEFYDAQFKSLATGLFFAETALIAGWNFNNELIWSQNDNMGQDGRTGSDIRMWVGSTFANRANAPTRIYGDGRIYTEKLIAKSAEIQGKFESNSNGNRIVIDPDSRCLKFIDKNSRVVGVLDFYLSAGNDSGGKLTLISYDYQGNVVGTSVLWGGMLNIYSTTEDNANLLYRLGGYNGNVDFFINPTKLLASSQSAGYGGVYRNGNTLMIKT